MRLESEFKRAFLLNAFQIVWQKVPFFNGRRNEAFRHLTQTIRFFQVEIKFTLTSGMVVNFWHAGKSLCNVTWSTIRTNLEHMNQFKISDPIGNRKPFQPQKLLPPNMVPRLHLKDKPDHSTLQGIKSSLVFCINARVPWWAAVIKVRLNESRAKSLPASSTK